MIYEFRFGTPEDYGVYMFLLEDGSIEEGYYSSFEYPNHKDNTIRCADIRNQCFYYARFKGWFEIVGFVYNDDSEVRPDIKAAKQPMEIRNDSDGGKWTTKTH